MFCSPFCEPLRFFLLLPTTPETCKLPKKTQKSSKSFFKTYCFICRCDGRWLFSFYKKRAAAPLSVVLLIADLQKWGKPSTAGNARLS
jgi:hypothetical protein